MSAKWITAQKASLLDSEMQHTGKVVSESITADWMRGAPNLKHPKKKISSPLDCVRKKPITGR